LIGRWSPARPHAARRSMVHIYGDACGRGTACIVAAYMHACRRAGGARPVIASVDRSQAGSYTSRWRQPTSERVRGGWAPAAKHTVNPTTFSAFFSQEHALA
jgi:hypothetical protein